VDEELLATTRWAWWRHGEHWDRALTEITRRSSRLVVGSPQDRDEVLRLFGVEGERVAVIANGVDVDRFDARPLDAGERRAHLRRWLVDEPQGWDETGVPGTVRYREADLTAFDGAGGDRTPVLLYVGRFLGVKRVPLLVRAYGRARARLARPAPLVIWGGHPGEWEGEHPHTVARREGVEGVFFVGWRGHDDLPAGLGCADVMVAPSVKEGFGQVYVEAMACGVPVIATHSGGQVSFVNTDPARPNGWLVDPDDEEALADAMVAAVVDGDDRRRRGANAYAQIRAGFDWRAQAGRHAALYEELVG
jgi:D-inositol-3-phosphate glycosyltransferase